MSQNETSDYLLKECELVQNVISRMANNQFYIKGWTITLVIASLLLKGNVYHYLVAFIPLLIFWIYDSYFLRLEKLYRAHYNWIIDHKSEKNEFHLDIDKTRIENRLRKNLGNNFIKSVPCLRQTLFSKIIFVFYFSIVILVISAVIFDLVF